MAFINDFSKKTFLYIIKIKFGAFAKFKVFKVLVDN